MVGPRTIPEHMISFKLIVEGLKLLGLLYLLPVEIFKELLIWKPLHAQEGIVPLCVKHPKVVPFSAPALKGH